MRVLITGAGGFVGSHIADYFANICKKKDVVATYHKKGFKNIANLEGKITIKKLDINNKKLVNDVIKALKPDYIYHMAAQSYVMPSWQDPEGTIKTNILGTLNILDSVKSLGLAPTIVLACSSAEYGINYSEEIPIKETKEFRPSSPYAVSKIGQDMIGYLYWLIFGMKIIRLRYFNIVGPRKVGNLCADFAKGIAEIEKGKKKGIGIGSLSSIIDLIDIKDAVSATVLAAEKGNPGDVYNVCTGNHYKVKDVFDMFIKHAKVGAKVFEDPKKKRPKEDPIFVGDNSKLRKLGWSPKIPIEQSVSETLEYWRNEVK